MYIKDSYLSNQLCFLLYVTSKEVIKKYNTEAQKDSQHPRAVYREPSALIVICATVPVGYTTENGVKIVPVGCLRD